MWLMRLTFTSMSRLPKWITGTGTFICNHNIATLFSSFSPTVSRFFLPLRGEAKQPHRGTLGRVFRGVSEAREQAFMPARITLCGRTAKQIVRRKELRCFSSRRTLLLFPGWLPGLPSPFSPYGYFCEYKSLIFICKIASPSQNPQNQPLLRHLASCIWK